LTARLEKTILSEKMIEEDLSRVEKSATKSTYRLGVSFERYEDKGEKSALKFIPSSTYHKEEAIIKTTKAHYPSNPKSYFNLKREVRKETPKLREKGFICMFCDRAGHLDEFCFRCKKIEKMHFEYETHIVMSSLIFRLVLTLVLHLALLHVLFLSSLMYLTIAHMVLDHERTVLSLNALVMAHVLIVVIVPRVSPVFLQESFTPVLSRHTWTVHAFSIVVLIPLIQIVMCKRL
jgi:hypothetical protein